MCKFIASSWVMHVFEEAGVYNIHILGMGFGMSVYLGHCILQLCAFITVAV
jgi:hypothetical protein